MASPITSLKVISAATTMAVASALPSGPSGSAAACNRTFEGQLIEQLRGRGLVEDGKTRGDIGLERELVQQPRAEGVDGLHLQPARCLERRGKQPPRPRAFSGARCSACAEPDLLVQRGIVESGPRRQSLENLVRHVGGRGLGEGDAENLGRIDAAQQQIDHALRQHIGLARAGIGRDEGGDFRVGGVDLDAAHMIGDGAGGAHGKGRSSSTPPASDHSFTRAR